MALMSCPNCGQNVSDKALYCVHCGASISAKSSIIVCPDCGTQISNDNNVCPVCGYPLDSEVESASTIKSDIFEALEKESYDEYTEDNHETKKKRVVGILISVVSLIVIAIGIYIVYHEYRKKVFEDKYAQAVWLMIEGAGDAETACSIIHDVWYNTIFEEDDEETDKYTKKSNGEFYDDFNDSLYNLMHDNSFSTKIEYLIENQDDVRDAMKELKDHPKECDEAYDALKDLYDSYSDMTSMAVNPTGNLTSYTSEFNDLDKETLKRYKEVELYMED